jgi:hypothetical protein
MFHPEAVPVGLLEVLRELREKVVRAGFALAGGTSLAIRFGHRVSVDLNFLTTQPFEPGDLASQLGFGPQSILGQATGTLQVRIQNVKVEFLRHAYPKLSDDVNFEEIRMWSLADVAAMKLNAISNRGSKKDFCDVAALLSHYSLPRMLDFYRQKYQPASMMMVIRSLAWFDDAETEPDPVFLQNTSWSEVVHKISTAIRTLE